MVDSKFVTALNFAAFKHKNQRRKDMENTPFINHPIGVVNVLRNEAGISDVDVLIAAILHDTIEDTDTTGDEIEEHFGRAIRTIVEECTDDKTLAKEERKRLQIENAHSKSYEAKLVKLADKIYNLRDLNNSKPEGWTEERVHEYFIWASKVFKGLRGTNKNLEKIYETLLQNKITDTGIVSQDPL